MKSAHGILKLSVTQQVKNEQKLLSLGGYGGVHLNTFKVGFKYLFSVWILKLFFPLSQKRSANLLETNGMQKCCPSDDEVPCILGS